MNMRSIGLLFVVAGVVVMVALEFGSPSDGASLIFTILGGVVALLGGFIAYQTGGDSSDGSGE